MYLEMSLCIQRCQCVSRGASEYSGSEYYSVCFVCLQEYRFQHYRLSFSFNLFFPHSSISDRLVLRKFVFGTCMFCVIFVSRLILWIFRNFFFFFGLMTFVRNNQEMN